MAMLQFSVWRRPIMMLRLAVFTILLVIPSICASPIERKASTFRLDLMHLNDFHARYDEVSPEGGECSTPGTCVGGFSRIYNVVNQFKKENKDGVFLNAGDNFQGTLWFTFFSWNVTQHFLNKLPIDATTLGNHEFDNKIEGLVPFLEALKSPVVAANIDDSEEPTMQNKYSKSVVIKRGDRKIGIIGSIWNETGTITSSGKLKFLDEVASINAEADRLIEEEGCDFLIVLSHQGYDEDKKIAPSLHKSVKLIVGGHSHSLLYNGEAPQGVPVGPYPTVVKNGQSDILVVQAYAYTRYLGNISIWFDEDNNITGWEGKPIYLDSSIPSDPAIDEELSAWREEFESIGNEVIGSTEVRLDQSQCRFAECNIGDMLTDSFVEAYRTKASEKGWSTAAVAILNSGGIRTSIPIGNITYGALVACQPFKNTLDTGKLKGSEILEFLEQNIVENSQKLSYRHFLQVSGMRITYNTTKPVGSRVQNLLIRCDDCSEPIFEEVQKDRLYSLVVPSFIANGGDDYTMIRDNLRDRETGVVDVDWLKEYLKKNSPIRTTLDGRITIVN